MKNEKLVWPAAILFICIGFYPIDVSGIWCYQCNSAYNKECANIKPNDTTSVYYKSCHPEEKNVTEMFCRKLVQKIHDREGLIRVVRSCGWILDPTEDCHKGRSAGREEISCQCFTDGCNSASTITSLFTIFTTFFFCIYIYLIQ